MTSKSVIRITVMYLQRFHLRPVVVVRSDGIPMGISPQCGPSTEDWMRISWRWVLGRSRMRQSSVKRTIRMVEKRHSTLIFPISWSNRPPSAPATRMHSCNLNINENQLKWQSKQAFYVTWTLLKVKNKVHMSDTRHLDKDMEYVFDVFSWTLT